MHAGVGDGLERAIAEALAGGIPVGDEERGAALVAPIADRQGGIGTPGDGRLAAGRRKAPPNPGAGRANARLADAQGIRLGLFRESRGELRFRRVAMSERGGSILHCGAIGGDTLAGRRRQSTDEGGFGSSEPGGAGGALVAEAGASVGGASRKEGRHWIDLPCWRPGATASCEALAIIHRPRSAPWYSATFEGAVHDLMIDLWARPDQLLPIAEGISLMLDGADLPLVRGALLSLAFAGLAEFDDEVRAARAWPERLVALGLPGPQVLLGRSSGHRRLFFIAETLDD